MYYYPNNAAGVGYMPPQSSMQNPQPQQIGLKGRPVSSLEEVRAAQLDFDGSLFIFPALAHNRIYTKQISMDGNASLNMYELTQIPSQQPIDNNIFVTREEFNAAIDQIKQAFAQPEVKQDEQPQQYNF